MLVLMYSILSAHSHIVVTAMQILWSLHALVVLFSVDAANSHKGSQGTIECVLNCLYVSVL